MAVSILPLFPLLSSHDPVTRLDASVSLLSSLPTASTSTSTSTSTLNDQGDTPYAIKRLVTGLGSSNDAARQGFAVALAELLARLPPKQALEVLPLILSTSTPTASADSREERDLLFGRLLGIQAVMRSGVLFQKEAEAGEAFKEAALALLAIAGKKSWIRESAFWVLTEALRALLSMEKKAVPSWRDEVTQWVVQRFLVDSREKARGWNPEKIALVLVLQSCGVNPDWVTILSPSFPSGNPLARSSLSTLAQAIKGSSAGNDSEANGKAPKQGSNAVKTSKNAAPLPGAAPHFVWTEIFDLYFPDSDVKIQAAQRAGAEGRARWSEVWRILVDQSLFAPPSLPLKATGFSLLISAIQRLPPAEVPGLFGEGVVRTFANHIRKSGDGEKTLQRVAEKLATAVLSFLTSNSSISLPLLKIFVAPPYGAHTFDSRTVERIVAKLDPKGVRGWIKHLKDSILGDESSSAERSVEVASPEEQKALTASRLWAFDQLLHVARTGSLEKDDDVLAGLLEFFAVLGWFEVRKSGKGARSYIPSPPLNETLQLAARSRFFSILTALPTPASGATWLSRGLGLLDNLSADSKHFDELDEKDEAVLNARNNVKDMLAKLSESVSDDRQRTARLLVEGLLLLSYDGAEDSTEALESLQDTLRTLFPDVFAGTSSDKASDDEDDDADMADGEAPEPATVLVDLLLELLHRPSAFVKGVVQTVFAGFASELGEQGLELILEQIRPEEVVAEDDDEDAAASGALDKPTVTGHAKADQADDDSDSSSASGSDDMDSDDEDEVDVDEAFKNELLAALQASGVAEELRSDDDDDEESSEEREEELLDDDQMMALDDKLADIFRLQGGGRKGRKADRTNDLHFRLRVVDLLETLAKQRTANPLLVHAALPLFNTVRRTTTLDRELQGKALKLLRQIVDRKEAPAPPSPQAALDALTELHAVLRNVDNAKVAPLCGSTALYLVKAALASPDADSATSQAISTLFGDSLEQYLVTKNARTRVQPAVTLDFVKRSPSTAWPLFARAITLSSSAVNSYRRMQAFEVAQATLVSHAALKIPESKADILTGMPAYRDAILNTLSTAVEDDTLLDSARFKELIKVALGGARITFATATPSNREVATTIWRGAEFATLLDRVRRSDKFQGATAVHVLLKQLLGVLGSSAELSSQKKSKKRKKGDVTDSTTSQQQKVTKSKKGAVHVVKSNAPEVEVEIDEDDDEVDDKAGVSLVSPSTDTKRRKKDKKRKQSQQ